MTVQQWVHLELWRWCVFAAGLPLVWHLSAVTVRGVLMALEARLFTVQQGFYFIIAIKASPPLTQNMFC